MIAYLDCSTGISGDKFLGALLSAGFTLEALRDGLEPLGLDDAVTVVERRSHGITGTGVEVADVPRAETRTWMGIRAMLADASLPESVRSRATSALEALARAESAVHGVPIEDVHFHEIGAADTIVDVVGTALGIHALGIERLTSSPVATGFGTVNTSHGVLPIPAPATALLLEGVHAIGGTIESELTTPTGAALAREFVSGYGPMPGMVVQRIGTGVGTRDIGQPNIARILIGEASVPHRPDGAEEVVVLSSNIDHVSPEHAAHAAQRLLDAGALDVWQTPIVMKKGRAALTLSVLTTPGRAPELAATTIVETGTLGVRVDPTIRYIAPRDTAVLATSFGDVRFKRWSDGRGEHVRAEYDDASRIARERGLPVADVARTLEDQARSLLDT